ncbi:MAG TPA: radical SAM protein [Anaeromyxobacteraceae bacterium]
MPRPPATRAGPRRITFQTNPHDCNLACRMCREHSPLAPPRAPAPPRRLEPAVVLRVLVERDGSPLEEVIPSTKGEPLLWEGLDRLADGCAGRGLLLNVTTNGTFPGRGAAAWAAKLAPVASDVKVSWNAATPSTAERVMRGIAFEHAVEDVRAFVAARDALRAGGAPACRVSFQVTAQEANVAELPAIVRLAVRLGVERVKVNQLQVHFPALAAEDLRRDAPARARWNEAVRGMRAAAGEERFPPGAPVLLENVEPWPASGEQAPYGPCPFLGREAWVTVEGRFAPCPAPAGQDGRLGDFGSVEERTLGEIWGSAAYRALASGYEGRADCRRCPLRRPGGV